ncbi:MAG: hypothetical protein ACE15D_00080 [Candidatus Eisenbacteria bacterium]
MNLLEHAEYLQSGVSILVGTRSDRLLPDCCRAVGARVEDDGEELTVFLPAATGEGNVENVKSNGRIAVCFSRARDHRSLQLKGQVVSIREGGEDDRRIVQRYRAALAEAFGFIGIPPRLTLRMNCWPCYAVRLHVDGIFLQTPGPGAGAALGGASR